MSLDCRFLFFKYKDNLTFIWLYISLKGLRSQNLDSFRLNLFITIRHRQFINVFTDSANTFLMY
jgi:hypothetical protein